MFGLISEKKLIKNVLEIYREEDTSKAWSEDNLMYRMGNANALNGLCARLGINFADYVKAKEAKE